jgi:hypothetical protein
MQPNVPPPPCLPPPTQPATTPTPSPTSSTPPLQEEFSDVLRFTASVFPSEDDDVVTSPYNAMLSLDRLLDSAHCVFPVENQALLDICARAEQQGRRQEARPDSALTGEPGKGAAPAAACVRAHACCTCLRSVLVAACTCT